MTLVFSLCHHSKSSPLPQHVCLIAHHSSIQRLIPVYDMLFSQNQSEELKPTRFQNARFGQGFGGPFII